jgi:anti-sigma factor RsiW
MTCEESEILLHALLDNELDAGHAREVEAHVAACLHCRVQFGELRALHTAMSPAELRLSAPASLRARVEAMIPAAPTMVRSTPTTVPTRSYPASNRRTLFKGFALGSMLSGAMAASLMIMVIRSDQDQRTVDDVVSAHLRSLQVEHLTDVQTSDQHTVKPWFNGRLNVAPPVIDLTTQGFTLVGGRLDYVNGRPVAAIVYRRRNHVLNLFVAPGAGAEHEVKTETLRGFSVKSWPDQGLDFWVVSDINADELQEFVDKFKVAARSGAGL